MAELDRVLEDARAERDRILERIQAERAKLDEAVKVLEQLVSTPSPNESWARVELGDEEQTKVVIGTVAFDMLKERHPGDDILRRAKRGNTRVTISGPVGVLRRFREELDEHAQKMGEGVRSGAERLQARRAQAAAQKMRQKVG